MVLKAYIEFNNRYIEGLWSEDSIVTFADAASLAISEDGDCINAIWRIKKEGSFRFFLTFSSPDPLSHVFIPSVWYRGNEKGEGLFPKESKATFWSFLETRMSIPGLIIFITSKGYILTNIEEAKEKEFISSVSWFEHGINYAIPGKEWPYSYRGKKSLVDTSSEENPTIYLKYGDNYCRKFYIKQGKKRDELDIYEEYIRDFNDNTLSCDVVSWNDYYSSKLIRLLNLTYSDDDGNAYIKMGEENGLEQPIYEYTSASFLVKSIEAACSFASINDYQNLNDDHLISALERIKTLFGTIDLKVVAEKIGDHFLKAETYPGVFQDCESLTTGERGGYLGIGEHPEFMYQVNSRCCGEAMSSYVRLYSILKKSEYLALLKRVATFFVSNQLKSGSYGRWWTKEGVCINDSGTNGAYIGVFLIKLLPHLTEEEKVLVKSSIDKALSFYSNMALSGDFYGDTLDADSADKEAGVSLMSLFLEALENFGDSSFLITAAKKAASFVLTWVWQKDSFISPSSQLCQTGFKTKGLTSVSIAHHHLDFYGMLIAKDMLRLYKLTKDKFYYEQALLILNSSRQLIDLKPGNLGRNIYGFQPEQINHTSWDYFSREDHMNGTFDIDIAWNNVLGLSSYLCIKENFPEVLEK